MTSYPIHAATELFVVCLCCCSKAGKKATSCTFSADSQHIFFSDRFGDVLAATVLPAAAGDAAPAAAAAEAEGSTQLPAAVEANLLLGHLQSIVTSLACCSSATGRPLLVSTDKDGKVRASLLPADPLKVKNRALLPAAQICNMRALSGCAEGVWS